MKRLLIAAVLTVGLAHAGDDPITTMHGRSTGHRGRGGESAAD